MRGLAGRTAVVTGATQTMGEAIARRLAEEGCQVVGFGRSADLGEDVARRLRADGGEVVFCAGDVTDAADVAALVDRAEQTYGGVDIVVNNAAAVELIRSGFETRVATVSYVAFDQQLKVGLYGPLLLAQAVLPGMVDRRRGTFVSISSQGGRVAYPGMSGYGPVKAAIEALTRQIAGDYGANGIRANSVVVGSIRVAQNAAVHDDPDLGGRLRAMQMLPHVGRPDHVASAVAFLASDEAEFVTGVSLPVEGGVLAKGPMPTDDFDAWMDGLVKARSLG
jgi:NAD(P)-dependent dehydrogenase (short-subunit alcohol dehydrogenase family)